MPREGPSLTRTAPCASSAILYAPSPQEPVALRPTKEGNTLSACHFLKNWGFTLYVTAQGHSAHRAHSGPKQAETSRTQSVGAAIGLQSQTAGKPKATSASTPPPVWGAHGSGPPGRGKGLGAGGGQASFTARQDLLISRTNSGD